MSTQTHRDDRNACGTTTTTVCKTEERRYACRTSRTAKLTYATHTHNILYYICICAVCVVCCGSCAACCVCVCVCVYLVCEAMGTEIHYIYACMPILYMPTYLCFGVSERKRVCALSRFAVYEYIHIYPYTISIGTGLTCNEMMMVAVCDDDDDDHGGGGDCYGNDDDALSS